MLPDEEDNSLDGAATYAVRQDDSLSDMSLGDEGTVSDKLVDQETVIDDGEVFELESRYRIENTLGRGGMGEVLLAVDTRLDRKVAIKRILGEAARSTTAVERFLTEAKSIAAINHPNVVQIYDHGRAKDGPFLVMEYVEGGSLLNRCRDGALPLEEAVDLTCQLCDGLAKAHDKGIVHRDIKPANVLLTTDGLPKLTDFGLAKAEASDHQMTMAGAVLGTPDFMPPEQRRDAAEVDARSDLWSLAATLYQMVTGRSPKIIRFRDVPDELEEVLGKALEESKDDRFQTIKDFRDALTSSLTARGASSKPSQIAGTLVEGQCKACGTITNDLNKKFCRNPECGASLRVACLKCEVQIPVWDAICGECGGNQPQIFSQKQADFDKACQQAEEAAAELKFGSAKSLLRSWLDVDQRFDEMKSRATSLLSGIENAEKLVIKQRDSHVNEARLHFSAKDYDSVIATVELIPSRMATNESSRLLSNAKECAAERQDLLSQIKTSLKEKDYSGLREKVARATELTDGRNDLQQLAENLFEREQRQLTALYNAKSTAAELAARGQYRKAIDVLEKIGDEFLDDGSKDLLVNYDLKAQESEELIAEIRDLWDRKEVENLPAKITRALELHPNEKSLLAIQQKACAAVDLRKQKIYDAHQVAEMHAYRGDFRKAVEVLEKLAEKIADGVSEELKIDYDLKAQESEELLGELKVLRNSRQSSPQLLTILERCTSLMPGRDDISQAYMQERSKQERRKADITMAYEQAVVDFENTGVINDSLAKYEYSLLAADQQHFLDTVRAAETEGKKLFELCMASKERGQINQSDAVEIANKITTCCQLNPGSGRIRQVRTDFCRNLMVRDDLLNAVLMRSHFLHSPEAEDRNAIREILVSKVEAFEQTQEKYVYRPWTVSIICASILTFWVFGLGGIFMYCVRGTREGVGRLCVGWIFIAIAIFSAYLGLPYSRDSLGVIDWHGFSFMPERWVPMFACALFFFLHGYKILSTQSKGAPIPNNVFRASELVKEWQKEENNDPTEG